MTWKTRVLKMVAGLRRFVRRASRHMIRIRIENTIRQVTTLVPAAPAASVPSIPKLLPCVICGRAPQQIGHWCFTCSVMPKYLMRSLASEPFAVAQEKVHAWQDAAQNN